MMRFALTISVPLLAAGSVFGQRCDSIAASNYGGWKLAKTAPHDGTVVELMETYGIAPWYGIFKWTKEMEMPNRVLVGKDGKPKPPTVKFKLQKPTWVQLDDLGHVVDEDACLFWRPYKGNGKYVDPTGGAQHGVAYWCAAMHRPYDKKTDTCK